MNVPMRGEEDDRHVDFGLGQFLLKLKAAHPWQPHIEHQAAWRVHDRGLEKGVSRAEKLDLEPDRLKKLLKDSADRSIVVDHEDGGIAAGVLLHG